MVNVVTGRAPVVGEALLRHRGVDKIAFTGSTAVGRHAASVAGENLKPVTMELGGNAAHIVFEDADVDKAIGAIIKGFVFNTGQFCMGGPRLLVARPLYETVLGILGRGRPRRAGRRPARPGHRRRTDGRGASTCGRSRSTSQLAREEGGRIVAGGERLDLDGGYYYKPTVIADLPNASRVVQEEIFGPVLTVQPFDTEDEAIALANSTRTASPRGCRRRRRPRPPGRRPARRPASSGSTTGRCSTRRCPFGGVKDSGFGREYGPEALASYTKVKSVVISLD